ncbi:TetR/AcrR family transcriptional regulator [Nocardia bhagyanarayanae]|uniref:TetR family transcriptional regulator n=1 Tax=Nocardia bhagyanarayanae TaxID=1215925 RepID=A0A543F5I4_9NOCA|nr:TetR/AcrR family transcriptional regulator [Nocardia bhagyanarayanae]TQM29085.1 TetR family transcriptional regulator [Nocardia bhagyanarayanae]
MGSRREQAEWRRERLLDAALDAFAAKGIDGTSVKDIAAAAEVTPGLLYHYFASKQDLVIALLRERGFSQQLRESLAQAGGRSAVEVVPQVMRKFDTLLADNAKLVALFLAAGRSHQPVRTAFAEFLTEGQSALAEYLRSRVEAGELRAHDPRTIATALFAPLAVAHSSGLVIDVEELAGLVLHGLVRSDADTPTEGNEDNAGS